MRTAVLSLTSEHTSIVDRLRTDPALMTQVLGVVGFAVLAALGAQVRIYLWEIPITLQTVAIYGSGLFLGARNGSLSMLLYLIVGMFLPVFASASFGPAYLFGLSGGYLLAAPIAAAAIGMVSNRWKSLPGSFLSVMVGSLILFGIGVTWLHLASGHESLWMSVEMGWLRFVVWDLAKVALVATGYAGLRRMTATD